MSVIISKKRHEAIRWTPRGRRVVQRDAPGVSIRQTALLAMWTHLEGDQSRERGGFLVGPPPRRNGSRLRVAIDDYLPALRATGTQTSLEIPPEDFFSVQSLIGCNRFAILGWAHSHPGLGVFLSSYDHFLWTSFFGEPHQLAIVVDPVATDGAIYGRAQGNRHHTMKIQISEIRDRIVEPQLRWSGYRRR
jgi:proteasome lid subunit RPN8/RPN11